MFIVYLLDERGKESKVLLKFNCPTEKSAIQTIKEELHNIYMAEGKKCHIDTQKIVNVVHLKQKIWLYDASVRLSISVEKTN